MRNCPSNCPVALIAIALGLTLSSFGQTQRLRFSHVTPDEGLVSSNALTVVQDYQGFFWFGTEDGLQRYDGYSFKNYFFDKSDSTSLSSNFVPLLYEDSHRNLWIGTMEAGLCLYDRENDRFIRFQNDPRDSTSIVGNFIQSIFESSDGTLYVSSVGHGFSSFKIPSKITDRIAFTNIKFPDSGIGTSTRWVSAIVETAAHGMLVAINGDGLYQFDTRTHTFTPFLKNIADKRIQCMLYDSKKRLWIGSWNNGLTLFGSDFKKSIRHVSKNQRGYLADNQIYSVTEDDEGNFWIGTDDGLNLINKIQDPFREGSFETYKHEDDNEYSLLSNSIKYLYIDKLKRVWIATYFGGINLYDKNAIQFHSIRASKSRLPRLTHNNVFALEADASGDLWVGTDGSGLNYMRAPINFSENSFTKIPLMLDGQSAEKIKCLRADKAGRLWVGTWGHGLFEVSLKDHSVKNVEISINRERNISAKEILAIEIDSVGNLWIGTYGFGVIYFDVHKKSVVQFQRAESSSNSNETNKVNDIYLDKTGKVWVARDGGGLSVIDPKTGKYRTIETGLLTNHLTVASIMEDSKGTFWLGTNSDGLLKYDRQTSGIQAFNNEAGLKATSVVSMLEDPAIGSIWVGTNTGLSSIDATGKIINFVKSDGLQGSQFNNNSALWYRNTNTMFFGGVEGLTSFQPGKIHLTIFEPPIVFTDFKLNNKQVSIGPNSSLKRNITLTDRIDLRYFEDSFILEFAALEFGQSQRTRYIYMLENFNSSWVDLGTEHKVTFTALPPGEYTLKVRATDNSGVLMPDPKSITIIIHPAFWQTIFFKIAVAIVLLLAGYIVVRARLKYLNNQRIVLKQQVAEATAEIRKVNLNLMGKVQEISSQNSLLQKQRDDISERDKEILAQNEELTSQNEQILSQRQDLEEAHSKLKLLNDQLEELVEQRTLKLEETIRELDTVVSELDRFVYSASHDLSAPLKSVLGLVNIARMEKDQSRLGQYYNYIEKSIGKLDNVIKSLVEFSRNTHLPVTKSDINLHNAVNEVIEELIFWPEAQSVKVINEVAPGFIIKSDPDRLKVILHNLVGNAIKYADCNKTTPSVWISAAAQDHSYILEVTDNGIGIEKNNLSRIFDMYYRGSSRSKGSGLGLFIVNQTANKLNASVTVNSEYSVGTTFQVDFPY